MCYKFHFSKSHHRRQLTMRILVEIAGTVVNHINRAEIILVIMDLLYQHSFSKTAP